MSEIKVGESVKTKDGYIAKLIKIEQEPNIIGKTYFFDNNVLGDCDEWNLNEYYLENIIKHSPNIIDLIEESNIVEVLDIWSGNKQIIYIYDDSDISELKSDIENGFLKLLSITTAEQFNRVKYEV